jgi:hypothetical protein
VFESLWWLIYEDFARLQAGPLTTLRHKPLLPLVTLRESCCLASLVYPSPTLPPPSLPNFFLIHQPPNNQPTSTFLLYHGFTSIRYSRVSPGAIERRNGGHCAAGATKSPQYAASPSQARTSWRGLCPPQGIEANNGFQTHRLRYATFPETWCRAGRSSSQRTSSTDSATGSCKRSFAKRPPAASPPGAALFFWRKRRRKVLSAVSGLDFAGQNQLARPLSASGYSSQQWHSGAPTSAFCVSHIPDCCLPGAASSESSNNA